MNFVTRLFVFAAVLTVGVGGYKLARRLSGAERHTVVHIERSEVSPAEAPAPVELPTPPEPPAPAEASVVVDVKLPNLKDGSPGAARLDAMRIATTNGAAFLALRDDQIVAGLSDSIRQLAATEMKKDLQRDASSGVGKIIGNAVASSVTNLLSKEIEVPLSEIRSIEYRRNRIVIRYKGGEPSGLINLETMKGEGNRTLLEQFSEADARRFVGAVQARLK